ncbi:MAG TPA: GldG family protein, partial [Gemmatimonadales bacterium]|nr:GldG family protein [Gemmatimonadales bacterium]
VLSHFSSIDRGVLDLRDVVYFVTLAALFLVLAYVALLSRKLTARGESLERLRIGAGLLAVALVVVNLFGRHIAGRLDLTPGHSFTLSRATKQLLGSLPDLVTIKLFASDALPPEVAFLRRDVDDLLTDYRSAGAGKVRVVIANPSSDTVALREARSAGIPPIQFNVVGRSELQVKEGFLGIAVRYAEAVKTIPFVQQTSDLEYRLTADIRALTHPEKSTIALGEITDAAATRSQRSFEALREQLGQTYDVRPFALTDSAIAPTVRVIVVAGTPDSLRGPEAARLRAFLERGGSLLVMASGMQLSPQGPLAMARQVGWNELLKPYGVSIGSNMVYDLASNAQVGMPSQFGQVLIGYPLWIRALSTRATPVNAEVSAVMLPWASQIDVSGAPPATVTPLFVTSRASGLEQTTAFLDPGQQFSRDSLKSRTVAVLVNPLAGATAKATPLPPPARGRLVVVGSGDFASDRYARNSPENLLLVLNSVDWLAQDEALIGIRSKNRAPPPLVFASTTLRSAVKYFNWIGVPLALVLVGVLRLWRRSQMTRRTYQPLTTAAASPAAASR